MPSADDADDLARLRGNPAVALLLDRAPPAVQLTPNTARALAEICVDLDGLPLAIELAAARLRVFTPSELAFRLGRRMSVLTSGPRDAPDRHRDLRAAIAWSHDLLSDRDRAAFRRLSVFPGEWDLESAAAVCAEPDVLDVVESLLDKSLVRRAGEDLDGNARFTMLMSLREYAAEQLAEQAEEQATRRPARHLVHASRPGVGGDGRHRRGDRHLAAAGHLPRRPGRRPRRTPGPRTSATQVVWLAAALAWFGYTRGVLAEAEVPLGELVAAADDERADPEARAAARLAAGVTAYGLGRRDVAEALLGPFRAAEGAPEERRGAVARAFLGHLARARGDLAEATRALHGRAHHARAARQREGHRLGRPRPRPAGPRRGPDRRGGASCSPRRWSCSTRSTTTGRSRSAPACSPRRSLRRGSAADVDRAAALLARALRLHDAVGDRRGIAQCLEVDGRGGARARRAGDGRAARRCRAPPDASAPPPSRPRPRSRQLAELDQRLDRHAGPIRCPARAARGPHHVTGRSRRPGAGRAGRHRSRRDAEDDVVVADPAAAGGGDPTSPPAARTGRSAPRSASARRPPRSTCTTSWSGSTCRAAPAWPRGPPRAGSPNPLPRRGFPVWPGPAVARRQRSGRNTAARTPAHVAAGRDTTWTRTS